MNWRWLWQCSLSLVLIASGQLKAVHAAGTVPAPLAAVPKYALVIGNSIYGGSRRSLKNPARDAHLMADTLRRLGFDVRLHTDLSRTQMANAVAEFSEAMPEGATAFVFYAGHGMQIGGASYLIPVDMAVTSEQTVPLRAYPLKMLLERVSAGRSAVNVVVLDACRDNPFQPAPPVRYRSFNNLGLAPIQAPRGTVVAYSTQPGQLAADGQENNSVYTAALANVLLEPRLTLEDIFKKVNMLVRNQTRDDQIPWYESSLTDAYFFLPPEGVTVKPGRTAKAATADSETKSSKRGGDNPAEPGAGKQRLWYVQMSDYEWSEVDWEIQQRIKRLTEDEVPLLKHQAKGGNVIAMTTLGMAYLEGISKATDPVTGKVMRYQANNTLAYQWLNRAARDGFPVATAMLAELYYKGQGVQRDRKQALRLTQLAAKANYPRAKLNLLQLNAEAGQLDMQSVTDALDSTMRAVVIPRPVAK
jgi:uncharacterized caspase-like protein